MHSDTVKISKFLSLVLRHEPQKIGLTLDDAGWISVNELLAACKAHGKPLTLVTLQSVVAENDKQRFSFSADGTHIRANQGHSIEVELGYESAAPPDVLYHGTATRFLHSIRAQGLVKGARHHVHLSAEAVTAQKVGARHGKVAVLQVQAATMQQDGYAFYLSANGVWLTEHGPVVYLIF